MRKILITLILFAVPLQSFAQDDDTCGNGLPCGSVPWALPEFPDLNSPTPIIVDSNWSPGIGTPTPTTPPSPTPFSFPSPTPITSFDMIGDRVQTIEAMIEATDVPIYNAYGTPVSLDEPDSLINEESTLFFSYVKGMNTNTFGILSPIVNLLVFILVTSFLWQAAQIAFPLVVMLVGIIRKIVQFILDFIPG